MATSPRARTAPAGVGVVGLSADRRRGPGRQGGRGAAPPDRDRSRRARHRADGQQDRPARLAERVADGLPDGRQQPPRAAARRSGEHVDRRRQAAARDPRRAIEIPHPRLRRAGAEAARDGLSRGRLAGARGGRVLLLPLRLAAERRDQRPPLLPRARRPLPPDAAGHPARRRPRPLPRRARRALRADVRRHAARQGGAAAAGDLGRRRADRHPVPRRDPERGHLHRPEVPRKRELLFLAPRSVLARHAVHLPLDLRHAPRPRRAPDRPPRQGPPLPLRRSRRLGAPRLVGGRPPPQVRDSPCRAAGAPGARAGAARPVAGRPGADRRDRRTPPPSTSSAASRRPFSARPWCRARADG